MLGVHRIAAIAAILATVVATDIGVSAPWAASDSLVYINNTSPADICYKVEFSSGLFPTDTTCDSSPGFVVKAGQTVSLHTGAGFNGAITAIINNVKGIRNEINFAAAPGGTWYDTDYELGMSDGTLGPADGRQRSNGGQRFSSLSGEQNTLAKANAAWPETTNKAELTTYNSYIAQGSDGKLVHVYMDGNAPEVVTEFFQLTANFTAYIGPGSVSGAPSTGEMTTAANMKSWIVDTQVMEITAY
ncbi:hypothetical protein MMC28_004662 [Mycoblastus sanguinarius]|nr:hypothetical protein [Mycoblastus sanguinarius]